MALRLYSTTLRRILLRALPLALCLIFLITGIASAHAILLRSDPRKDDLLPAAPSQVRMWFSEDLNPAFSTAVVVNANNQRVDRQDAHVSTSDLREMDVTRTPNLQPSVYVVVWLTDSPDDGHILCGAVLVAVNHSDGNIL